MRRVFAILSASLVLTGLLAGAGAGAVSAQEGYARAGFVCSPRGTIQGSPTTTLSTLNVNFDSPASSTLTCYFRGTSVPSSFGGPRCLYEDAAIRVDFRFRLLVNLFGSGRLVCWGATITTMTDLTITKTAGSATAVPGLTTTYTVVVGNAGAVPGTATVTDNFAAAITNATWTSVAAGGATGNTNGSGNIAETLALPAGATVTYTVTATIGPGATGTLDNTASVAAGAGTIDTNLANNISTASVTLTPQADLAITLVDGVNTFGSGGPVVYTVTVTNNGPSWGILFGVVLNQVCPTCVSTVDLGTVPSLPINLAPGQSAAATFTVTVTSVTANGTLVVTVTALATTLDPNPANNSATDSNTVVTPPAP